MINSLREFFSPQAGQDRRDWLNRQEDTVEEYLRGYLGPAANPLLSAAQIGGMLSPGADMMDGAAYSRDMWNADSAIDAATAGAGLVGATAMMALPGNMNALREGFGSVVDDMAGAYDPSRLNALIAYHGSPHTFDRFDISKIGTGEGAQAYGHGLYFAESEDVANNYRAALRLKGYDSSTEDQMLRAAGFTPEDLRQLQPFLSTNANAGDAVSEFANWTGRSITPEMRQAVSEVFAARPTGSMYEVQINADPADFLDWDAPISDQSTNVRNALGVSIPGEAALKDRLAFLDQEAARLGALTNVDDFNAFFAPNPELDAIILEAQDIRGALSRGVPAGHPFATLGRPQIESMMGADIVRPYSQYQGGRFENSRQSAEALLDAGIPGVQYLDAGSRSSGLGTRNFVVFDDSIISILRRYGIGAAAVGGGWAMTPQDAQAASDLGILDPEQRERQQIVDYVGSL
jgi:hypothetical protein